MPVQPVPAGYHTVTPHLMIAGAAAAIEFYKKAFGAEECFRMPGPDGKTIMHADLLIGNSHIFIGDESKGMGDPSPKTLGGTPTSINLYVKDADAVFNKAVAAGATVTMPLTNMFWGDRYGKLTDPFGHSWSVATHIEDVGPEDMEKRAAEAMKGMGTCQ